MMAAAVASGRLIDRLPAVRGRLSGNAPLAPVTWFRVGGAAEVLFRPADAEDLAAFVAAKPADVPLTVIGVGSNLLVRDGGVPGVVVRLGRGFAAIEARDGAVDCGAAALDLNVALFARDAGLAGLEFLSGIPGTIGGALRMNAGAYGREVSDVLLEAEAIDPSGARRVLAARELGLSYRHCALPEAWIFTAARLRAEPGDIRNAYRFAGPSGEVEAPQPAIDRLDAFARAAAALVARIRDPACTHPCDIALGAETVRVLEQVMPWPAPRDAG